MQITGTNLIVGTLTFSLLDPFEHSYREVSIVDGQTITLADHFRFDTNITSNVTGGYITLLIQTTDRAVQSDLSGGAAGSDTQVQFNNSGAFGASADFTWDGQSIGSKYGINGNSNLADFSVTGYAPITGAGQSVVVSGGSSSDDTGGSVSIRAGLGTTNGGVSTQSDLLSIKNISGGTTLATFAASGTVFTVIGGETRLEGDLRLYGNGIQGKITDPNGTTRIKLTTGSGNTVELNDGGPNLRVAIEQGSSIRFYDTTTTVSLSIDDTNINVAKHLLPTVDNTYNVGTNVGPFRFKDGYFGGTLGTDILNASFAFFTNATTGVLVGGGGSGLLNTMTTLTNTTNTTLPFGVKAVAGSPIFLAEVGGIDVAAWGSNGALALGTPAGLGAELLHVYGESIFEARTYSLGDHVIADATKGLVLKDTQGTPHYWRVTVNNTGNLVTTDVGTTPP